MAHSPIIGTAAITGCDIYGAANPFPSTTTWTIRNEITR
jgi:hypothetical protein